MRIEGRIIRVRINAEAVYGGYEVAGIDQSSKILARRVLFDQLADSGAHERTLRREQKAATLEIS